MDAAQIGAALDDVFDHALVFHGFTDYMRDYDVFVHATSDPATGIPPEYLRYRFKHCVHAAVTSSVAPQTWRESLDDAFVDGWEERDDLDGYVWGVRWQVLYPGAKVVADSEAAGTWSQRLGMPMHEVVIEANGHHITLVFADLVVDHVEPGHVPFRFV
ncbi:hypothetical protein JNUCC0626_42105 [Lentzea sp. JNUCC 0626]|uniref:YxiG-like protein n=1 Tax=Lentzea sp. JNUCC 0626 TaxID=3367513 RepID=UPI00374A8DDB